MEALVTRNDVDLWRRVAVYSRSVQCCANGTVVPAHLFSSSLGVVGAGRRWQTRSEFDKLDQADYCYQRILRLAPNDIEALIGRATVAMDAGRTRPVRQCGARCVRSARCGSHDVPPPPPAARTAFATTIGADAPGRPGYLDV